MPRSDADAAAALAARCEHLGNRDAFERYALWCWPHSPKSHILSHAADAAMKTGVDAAVVNIGGDLTVRGTLIGTG